MVASPSDSLHRRVRWSLYLAFALLACVSGVGAWLSQRGEQRAQEAAAMMEAVLEQRGSVERIGRLTADPAAGLARVLEDARASAQSVDPLLAATFAADSEGMNAMSAWTMARDRLWSDSEALLAAWSGHRPKPDGGGHVPDADIETAWKAANTVVGALRRAQQTAADAARRRALLVWLASLGVLGALAVLIVEPTTRAVRRHHKRQVRQAAELERLALVAENTDNLVIVTDSEHRIVWVNDAFTRTTGYTLDDALGVLPEDLVASSRTDPAELARMKDALQHRQGVRAEVLNRAKSGRDYWVDIDVRPLHDAGGQLTGFVHVETEITALMTQRLQLESLLAVLPDGVVVQAQDGPVVRANAAAMRLLGLTHNERLNSLATDPGWALLREDGSAYPVAAYPALRTLRERKGLRGELLGVQEPGAEPRWLLVNTEPLRDALGAPAGVVSCYVDVTEARRLQEQLSRLARIDALTELPNRTEVRERIARAIDHRRRHPGYGFAVLFLDFDHFKQVNDRHGHTVGDELLRQIAQRLQHALRPGDAVSRVEPPSEPSHAWGYRATHHTAARIGGDEFVIVLEGVRDAHDVHVVAERLLQSLTEPYVVQRCQIQSSVSIGVVLSPSDDADSVLRDADTAMYQAKRAGRGRYVIFDAQMHETVAKAVAMESNLRRALHDRELFVVYQPIVGLEPSGPLHGIEALVRWRHPVRGVLLPAEFVPMAEEIGLIGELGDFVLDVAAAQFARWKSSLRSAAPKVLSMNLSRTQLRDTGLVARIEATLVRHQMQPADLQLELMEGVIAADKQTLARMKDLRALGVRLALDDFGVGYSSLAGLHDLPVDTVKLDRSFVADARTSSYHRVVIEATVRVATAIGMTSVAVGIETEDQAELMTSLGCGRGQGYLYQRPAEAGEMTDWLKARARAAAMSRLVGMRS